MSTEEQSESPSEQARQPAKTFGEAVRRAGRSALTSSTIKPSKNHVLARGFEKSVAKPWADLSATIGAISDARKEALARRGSRTTEEIFSNVSQDALDETEHRSSWAWLTYQATYLMAIGSIIYSYQLSGLDSFAAFLSGIMLALYGMAMSLKSTRDILSIRNRRIVTAAEVIRDFDKHWRPVAATHPAFALHKYGLFPVTVGATVGAMYATVIN